MSAAPIILKGIMDDVPKDRYCSFRVTLETASAFYVELEPLEGLRTQFVFWRGDPLPESFRARKARIRDLRPGDRVSKVLINR
ncbi:MAG TPA: hypothetical protein DDW52_03070 [Planctomycetaceae bacterium]|nr:hypothetical protein [Planctomycetaceae bacterium]